CSLSHPLLLYRLSLSCTSSQLRKSAANSARWLRNNRSTSRMLGRVFRLFHGGRNHQSARPPCSSRNCNSRSTVHAAISAHCARRRPGGGVRRAAAPLPRAGPVLGGAEPSPRREGAQAHPPVRPPGGGGAGAAGGEGAGAPPPPPPPRLARPSPPPPPPQAHP